MTKLVAQGTSTGLIDIGATKIKDVEEAITDGKIASKDLVAGVTNDTIKSVTVTNLAKAETKDAIYGAIDQGESKTAKPFAINGVSLTLTGTGNLVYYTDTSANPNVAKLSAITFDATNSGTLDRTMPDA